MKNKYIKLLEKDNRIDKKNGKIKCNCDRWITPDDITWINTLDLNYFNWWSYQMIDTKDKNDIFKTKLVLNDKYKPYNYIGLIPYIGQFPYYLHKWFHKKKEILIIECKYCENEGENEGE